MNAREPARWASIRYRDFYDVPRAFVVEKDGNRYFFTSEFDEAGDEYSDTYRVYRLTPDALLAEGAWDAPSMGGALVGEVPVSSVRFDETRRKAVDVNGWAF